MGERVKPYEDPGNGGPTIIEVELEPDAGWKEGKNLFHNLKQRGDDVDKLLELELRFAYHAPREDQVRRYDDLRTYARGFAMLIIESTPDSREQSLALTNLEQAVMWANAAIARRDQG